MSNPCRIALCAELLLPDCVRFSCCFSRYCIDPFQLLLSSRLASASAAFRRLRPLQLLLSIAVNWFPIASASAAAPRMPTLLPDGVRFVCCSPIASASAAAPRRSCSRRFQHDVSNIQIRASADCAKHVRMFFYFIFLLFFHIKSLNIWTCENCRTGCFGIAKST